MYAEGSDDLCLVPQRADIVLHRFLSVCSISAVLKLRVRRIGGDQRSRLWRVVSMIRVTRLKRLT